MTTTPKGSDHARMLGDGKECPMGEQQTADALMAAALGLLDSVPVSRVRRLRRRRIATPTTAFHTQDVYALLDALERCHPGLLESYEEIRVKDDRAGGAK